jgi:hypothetical protein
MSIKRNAARTNQKVPTSNIVPKKDIFEAEENMAEIKNEHTIPNPDTRIQDRGTTILPPEKRAAVQKIIEIVNPITRSNPFEVSTGILINGKKNTGSKTITAKSAQNEILSRIFDTICY